jgi:hypothetical protein
VGIRRVSASLVPGVANQRRTTHLSVQINQNTAWESPTTQGLLSSLPAFLRARPIRNVGGAQAKRPLFVPFTRSRTNTPAAKRDINASSPRGIQLVDTSPSYLRDDHFRHIRTVVARPLRVIYKVRGGRSAIQTATTSWSPRFSRKHEQSLWSACRPWTSKCLAQSSAH